MRSCFRTWAAERRNYPREVAEAALTHTNGDRVEAAYLHSTHFNKRVRLMQERSSYLDNSRRYLTAQVIIFSLNRTFFDVTRYNAPPLLNCRIEGDFSTHLYGACRLENARYWLTNIPLSLPDGSDVIVSLEDIWTVLPFGRWPLTDEEISQAGPSTVEDEAKAQIRETYRATKKNAIWLFKRFAAAPPFTPSLHEVVADQIIDLIDPSAFASPPR